MGRSGSTLLGDWIARHYTAQYIGESRYVPSDGFIGNQRCTCGVSTLNCSFWQAVSAQLPLNMSDWQAVDDAQERINRLRNVPALFHSKKYGSRIATDIETCTRAYGGLFEAIREFGQTDWIVDSSKTPMHGRLVGELGNAEVHVLHLIRDSRAVAFSWTRTKQKLESPGGTSYMPRYSHYRTAAYWSGSNIVSELLGRHRAIKSYIRIRYEDFVASPEGVLDGAMKALELSPRAEPYVGPIHSIGGNPGRFSPEFQTIVGDSEWTQRPSKLVAMLTWPLLLRYGYALRPQR